MSLLGGSGSLAVALVLLAAGVGHLRDPRGLRAALATHDLLPARVRRTVALLLGPVELLLGAALLLSLATGDTVGALSLATGDTVGAVSLATGDTVGALSLATGDTVGAAGWLLLGVAVSATLLTGAFTAYLLLVLRRTGGAPEIPCGCGLGTTPVGPWAVVRAGLLTGLALLAVVGGTPDWVALAGTGAVTDGLSATSAAAPLWAHAFLVAAAGTTLAIAVAALPAARAVPASLTTLTALPAAPSTIGGHR